MHTKTSPHLAALAAAAMAATTAFPALADEALADLVEEVSPSVVTVLSTRATGPEPAGLDGFRMPDGSPFEEFFRQFGRERGMPDRFGGNRPQQGLGSGFVVDGDGLIVTNHHVIDGADSVTVRLADNREFVAEVVGTDAQTDLAVLRIDPGADLPEVALGDSDAIRVGEDVVAVGNPFGLGGTVTSGIVSAKGRNISAGPYADFIQTDAAINKGNSGGPLFNMAGEVVGVNSAIYSPSGGSVGVGFAVASNVVDRIVDDLVDDGQVDRGWLGVSIQTVTPDLAAALGLDEAKGALVSSVLPGGPSEGTLETGDVILAFAGQDVGESRDLPRLVGAASAGEAAEIRILRDGREETLSVELGAFEARAGIAPAADEAEEGTAFETLGATVDALTDAARAELGLDDGVEGVVVTSLSADGAASRAGLRVGDVIVRVGDAEVLRPGDLEAAIEARGDDPALMLINRGGRSLFLAVKPA